MSPLDDDRFARRLRPARADLAAASLRGQVEARRFAEGETRQVAAGVLDLFLSADAGAGLATQLLHGEPFTVYEDRPDGLAWGQAGTDGYVGYVRAGGLGPLTRGDVRVSALWSHIYSAPAVKAPITADLPNGARLATAGTEGRFVRLGGGGFVPAQHLAPLPGDAVDHALRFLGTPYLWGGCSARGIDCSGLVQRALAAVGIAAPRDTDMQEAALGYALPETAPPTRGDLVFWKGHVGLLADPETLVHANAHHMAVVAEPFHPAAARILAAGGGPVTSRRRPDGA